LNVDSIPYIFQSVSRSPSQLRNRIKTHLTRGPLASLSLIRPRLDTCLLGQTYTRTDRRMQNLTFIYLYYISNFQLGWSVLVTAAARLSLIICLKRISNC
jgi:hypothetical protein